MATGKPTGSGPDPVADWGDTEWLSEYLRFHDNLVQGEPRLSAGRMHCAGDSCQEPSDSD